MTVTKKKQKAKSKTPTSTDPIIPVSPLFGTWICPLTFLDSPPIVLPDEHDKYLTYARRQLAHCFDDHHVSKKMDKANGVTYSTWLSILDDDLFLDTNAASLDTTDQRRLSRFLIEDLVSMVEGTKLVILVCTFHMLVSL